MLDKMTIILRNDTFIRLSAPLIPVAVWYGSYHETPPRFYFYFLWYICSILKMFLMGYYFLCIALIYGISSSIISIYFLVYWASMQNHQLKFTNYLLLYHCSILYTLCLYVKPGAKVGIFEATPSQSLERIFP